MNATNWLNGSKDVNSTDFESLNNQSYKGIQTKKLLSSTIALLPLYGVIFVFGIAGNATIVYIISTRKHMRTVINVFIANLAVSDLLLCLIALPVTPLNDVLGPTAILNNAIFCSIVHYITPFSVFDSAWLSVTMAILRYVAVARPLKPKPSSVTCTFVLCFVWLAAIIFSLPFGIFSDIREIRNSSNICVENWPSYGVQSIVNISSLMMHMVIPGLIISFCYIRIPLILNSEKHREYMVAAVTPEQFQLNMKHESKINKMLILMIVSFMFCWFPFGLYSFLVFQVLIELNIVVWFLLHILAMSSVIYNPILYGFMNKTYRSEIRSCFRKSI